MSDVNISKYRAQVIRQGSTPASPGFAVAEGQNPVDPSGSGQTHLPVTIATVSTGLSITESQILSGAGLVSQYIRGDGSLADFPATTGGGSSVSYYLNGSVSQGTIGGVAYKEINRTPVFGAGTDITISADGYIASFITDALDPNKLLIPAGNWNLETYFSASSNGGSPSFYVELYKYNGTTFTLIATSSSAPELIAFGTNLNPYYSTLAVPETVLALTDRLALRYYVTHSGRTITLHTEDNHLCQVITTFTTGLTALNGLTSQVQYLTVGTSGTDFAISSVTDTHTFNLPTASAVNRGALSSADWTTFNNKTSNLGTVTSVGLSSATSGVTIGSTPVTTSGTITLAIATASGSQNGLLSSTDWTTFNGKQNALTNPVTGTGTTNYLPKFTGASSIGNSQVFDNGSVGINQTTLFVKLSVADGLAATSVGSDYNPGIFNIQNTNTTAGNLSLIGFQDASAFINLAAIGSINEVHSGSPNNVKGSLAFYTKPTGSGYITEKMRITSDGNLLVNTTTDAGFKLDVNGTGRFSSTAFTNLFVDGTNSNGWGNNIAFRSQGTDFGYLGSLGSLLGSTIKDMTIWATAGNGFRVYTNGNNQRLEISSTGAATFSGLITGQSSIYQSNAAGSIASNRWETFNGGATQMFFSFPASGSVAFNNGTDKFTISNTGAATFSSNISINNTGTTIPNIGATSSQGALELYSGATVDYNGGAIITLVSSDRSGSYTRGEVYISAGRATNNTANGFIQMSTGNAPRMTITSGGNVLIGTTTNGASKLRIVGLPTSAAGLSSGDVYNLAGVLMIA
jgi:hypothetical protein